MASIAVGPPSFSGSGSIGRFIADFKTFAVFHSWEPARQAAVLPLCLSGIARDAYDALPEKVRADVSAALAGLRDAFPSGGLVEAQVQLRGLTYNPTSDLDAFVVQLRGLVGRAFPGAATESLLFNYFLQSLPASHQRELISDGIQTFDRAVEKVRNLSCAARLVQAASSVRQVSSDSVVDDLRRKVQDLESRLDQLKGQPAAAGRTQLTCFCCGMPGHRRSHCVKRHLPCHTCGRVGHLARVCRQGNAERPGEIPAFRPARPRGPSPTQGYQWGPGPSQGQQWGPRNPGQVQPRFPAPAVMPPPGGAAASSQ